MELKVMDEQLEDMQGYMDLLRMAYNSTPTYHQPMQMVETSLLMAPTTQAPPPFGAIIPPQVTNQLPYLPPHLEVDEEEEQQHLQFTLRNFWLRQHHDIRQMREFKNHSLPLARVKKIMKADEDVRMIAAEAPVLFARACEMFVLELTLRSWAHAEGSKRKTLQRNDIATAIALTESFDFLVDIVPREKPKEESSVASMENPRAEMVQGLDGMPTYLNVNPLNRGVGSAGIMIPVDQGAFRHQQIWSQKLPARIEQYQPKVKQEQEQEASFGDQLI